jgi:hypothetical protein
VKNRESEEVSRKMLDELKGKDGWKTVADAVDDGVVDDVDDVDAAFLD